VDLDLMTGTADQVIDEIERGGLDLGIVYSPPQPPPPGTSEVLYREEFVVAVGKRHRLARLASVSLADLDGMPFITYSRTSAIRRHIERLFAAEGVSPQIVMELENEEAMERMIEIGMGIALLSKRRAESDRIRHLGIRGHQVCLDSMLVFPRNDYLPRAVAEFARLCREAGRACEPVVPRAAAIEKK
jgi:DNA-binding transcriptional LysR family regulator